MSDVQIYAAVAFAPDDNGTLQPCEAVDASTSTAAIAAARRLSASHGGALAFSRTGDPATGEFADGVELARFGTVPADLQDALSG